MIGATPFEIAICYFVKFTQHKVASFFEATIGAKANSNRRMQKFLADELPNQGTDVKCPSPASFLP
jgi:hypothetical protein